MSLKSITPQEAAALVRDGAVLVDVRAADERARERIPGSRHHELGALPPEGALKGLVVFHCKSGLRTKSNQSALAACVDGEAFIVEGGLDAWKSSGLPVRTNTKAPLPMQRQVMIAAGLLVLLGAALGELIDPNLWWLSAAVGAGLIFAGATGVCALARLLSIAPWNRARPA